MARIRMIKPGFFLDEDLADCGMAAQLLFAGLWTVADREGRLEDRPRRIKHECLPYYDVDVDALLDVLHDNGFIVRYVVDGTGYIAIPTWHKHQNPHSRELPSAIPEPVFEPKHDLGSAQARPRRCSGTASTVLSPAGTDTDTGTDTGTYTEKRAVARRDRFLEFWQPYPKKDSRTKCEAAFRKLDDDGQDKAVRSVSHLNAWIAATGTETRFVPGATVWLNQAKHELWCDGPPDGYEPAQYRERDKRGLSGDDLMALADSFEGRERLAIGEAT